ncbi:hypothetical protein MY04_4571 [Flammeovirga sp. MY04]|uniref:RHS repeat domain-containing protein n=1 Tax=Flammeovirga sp. MY04 TaxID=1191459 RepID=UPI000806344E|nr:RHS repeat-associated core domain-containing protein [Flammeovirga sp. MY04]ANQ51906.1 hypothetical protein MY04_4571 [Flammeovirga sp. MY04]
MDKVYHYGTIINFQNSENPIKTVTYRYDPTGNRISKRVEDANGTTNYLYIKDASGNSMAIVKNNTITEIPIYGSSRIGQFEPSNTHSSSSIGTAHHKFEYSNHLGNVLATTDDLGNVLSYSDYYPFGLSMESRSWSDDGYRYGFNGKENDTDLSSSQLIQDYGFRVYNPVIGKFLSVDPLMKSYPELTPYQFASNMPIFAIDLDGLESYGATQKQANETTSYATAARIIDKGKKEKAELETAYHNAGSQEEKNRIAYKGYARLSKISREEGWEVGADFLDHFLGNTNRNMGETLNVPDSWIQQFPSYQKGITKNYNYVINGPSVFCKSCKDKGLVKFALSSNIKEGETIKYDKKWETLVESLFEGSELSYTLGAFTIVAISDIDLTRKGNTITLSGTIYQSVIDKYDFSPGKNLNVMSFALPDDYAHDLQKSGKAKDFEVRGGRLNINISGTINLNDGQYNINKDYETPNN